jgi:UDP-N-acetylglucosamine--N-acetylmuramyl-(pentapeptide) pyrophosphoryl-undecaprenol N-acetylglucosamine transferase
VKVVLAGGGTGGHVYPGLSVARALGDEMRASGAPLDLLYIGIRGRVDETIVPRAGIDFRAISAGALRVGSPITFGTNMMKLAAGVVQSLLILRRFKPDVVFATGGYASVPVGVAARILRRPLVVYLPDVTPGWAVRLLSRLATRMTTTSERALAHLPAVKTTVVGYPVRDEFWTLDRAAARARLSLPAEAPVVLVTAGSLGARKINEAVVAALPRILDRAIVLHVTGVADAAWADEQRGGLTPEQQTRYIVRGYLDDMPAAMVAADLVVSRAGASSLGELPAAAAPSILVPGEYEGWSQAPNAEYLQAEGAAEVLRNADLASLGNLILELLGDNERLSAMRAAASKLARPNAARDLARVLIEESGVAA